MGELVRRITPCVPAVPRVLVSRLGPNATVVGAIAAALQLARRQHLPKRSLAGLRSRPAGAGMTRGNLPAPAAPSIPRRQVRWAQLASRYAMLGFFAALVVVLTVSSHITHSNVTFLVPTGHSARSPRSVGSHKGRRRPRRRH